ncbi:MAG TPA: hypothetical protein PKC29_14400 [Thermodesulfobacteriota bacterium]|nr:hypothetical protein [Thermodesulfobacteriota bacterium]
MAFRNQDIKEIIQGIDLGSSIAEQDTLLQTSRVDTSVFSDLWNDRIDLIPGTKGSGKSALYRIFVEFLPDVLLDNRKVVIAHGVNHHGDKVFHAFNQEFQQLSEDDFVNFWCIYIISLANEQLIKNPLYKESLKNCSSEITHFKKICFESHIPEIQKERTLSDILGWTLSSLKKLSPRLKYKPPQDIGEFELDLFGNLSSSETNLEKEIPQYSEKIRESLEAILKKANLSVWFMIDRLDEIFPRRSDLERKALRGLLKTIRIFETDCIRLKVFLRDDILQQVVYGKEGFTALTHVTSRKADTLRWSQDQILTMIVKRLFAGEELRIFLDVNKEKLNSSHEYRIECFYKVFPPQVFVGSNQSKTLKWIYNHTKDGNNVVTPRDVIDLLTVAKQNQTNKILSNPSGESNSIIDSQSIRYGLEELSKRKRDTVLDAEFPHLQEHILKFEGQKSEYTERALARILGKNWQEIMSDLASIGLFLKESTNNMTVYKIPFLYRKGLNVTLGRLN